MFKIFWDCHSISGIAVSAQIYDIDIEFFLQANACILSTAYVTVRR